MLEYYESGPIPDNVNLQNGEPIKLTYHRERVLVDKEQVSHGIEAVFVPIMVSDRGLKLYRCVKDGRLALQCQVEAHGFGLGPAVYSPLLEFVFPVGTETFAPIISKRFVTGKAYGYYTQIADTKRVPLKIESAPEYEALKTKCMELLSFKSTDLHGGNVGYVDDHLVLIDFGFNSTGTPTQRKRGHFSVEASVTHHEIKDDMHRPEPKTWRPCFPD